jgi:hypothetical protein
MPHMLCPHGRIRASGFDGRRALASPCRARNLRPIRGGHTTVRSLVNRTGSDHVPVRQQNQAEDPDEHHACQRGVTPRPGRSSSHQAGGCPRLRTRRMRRWGSIAPDLRIRMDRLIRKAPAAGGTSTRVPVSRVRHPGEGSPGAACGLLGRSQRPGCGLGRGSRLCSDGGD